MAASQPSNIIDYLRRVVRDDAARTDGELLASFIENRDKHAFASLVSRHGPMVWSLCRRTLANDQDAEDAFQATFLVLVRKAASIVPRGMVGNWLYGVAQQTALQARRTAARRNLRERQVASLPEPAAQTTDVWHDLRPLFDRELSKLPDVYRSVIVLCDLEGKTRKEAANQLGWVEGTVAGRLARAREMLAKRLNRHGLALSSTSLAAVLLQNAASAAVPNALVFSTIEAAISCAAGNLAMAGLISTEVAGLTRGVLQAMFLTKLKMLTVAFVLVGCFTAGGLLTYDSLGAERSATSKEAEPVAQVPPKDDETERAKADLDRAKARMADAQAILEQADASYKLLARKAATAKLVQEMKRALDQLPDAAKDKQKTLEALDGIEKALRQARDEIKNDGAGNPDPSKTQTDGLVWGKEVNGLQLGIGLRPGEKGVYNISDKVEFVVKLRNVSKNAIKYVFRSLPFEATVPHVVFTVGGDERHSQRVPVAMPFELTKRASVEMEIAPGEVIDVGKPRIELGLATTVYGLLGDGRAGQRGGGDTGDGSDQGSQKTVSDAPIIGCYNPSNRGKYKISYENIIQIGPTLSTGEIEIELKFPKDAYKDKVAGIWILSHDGSPTGRRSTSITRIDFAKNGEAILRSGNKDKEIKTGSYKVDGNKLTIEMKDPDGKDDTQTFTITTLTEMSFSFTNADGLTVEYKRAPSKP
jgi:uncharacterized protein (TIGR03066 family)